jgi:MOSC domain-containing protein YiiM
MEVVSINVGLPREVAWRGKAVSTRIFKSPVKGPVKVRTLNLEGDGQADLSVHGGPNKATYAYPAEHYDFWRRELPDLKLKWGHFGENFTIRGLLEEEVHIGDTFRIGSTLLRVTQPRLPCFKLGIRFGRSDMVKRFLASRFTGFYLAVLEEGTVETGDAITLVDRGTHGVCVDDITRLYAFEKEDWATMRRAIEVEALPESWRAQFRERLEKRDDGGE